MIYTPMTKVAINFMFEKHKDLKDKSGLPYVFHPFHVAEQMDDEDSTIVALLHDVVEDTDTTFDDLAALGFNQNVLDALRLLTHDPSIPYMEYIRKIKDNPLAKKVKIADLTHNSDTSRLDVVDDKVLERVKKYKEALELLGK